MPGPSRRSTFSPHPLMGLPPRWNVGDLEASYSNAVPLLINSGNGTSASYNPQANSIELHTKFTNESDTCTITVTNDDGTGTYTQVAQFVGVTGTNDSNLYVGALVQNITLQGRPIIVTISDYNGIGSVTISVKRLN